MGQGNSTKNDLFLDVNRQHGILGYMRRVKNKTILVILLLWLLVPTLAVCAADSAPAEFTAEDLQTLVRQVETQYNGNSAHGRMTMRIATEHWQRTLTMEMWSWQRERFLTRIEAPAKERGVATLKIDRDVWNYLPKVDRTIKIPSSMMGGSWMGSHITNDDLVKSSQVDKEYEFSLVRADEAEIIIDCLPQPDTVTVWGKLVYSIDRPTMTPAQIDYFDEDLKLVRHLYFDRIEQIGDRTIPMRMRVEPVDKPGESTELIYEEIAFDIGLTPEYFSLRNLKKR